MFSNLSDSVIPRFLSLGRNETNHVPGWEQSSLTAASYLEMAARASLLLTHSGISFFSIEILK